MSSIQQYFEKKSTEELQGILQGHCIGTIDLPIDTILLICRIIAERDPLKPNVKEEFNRFCEHYLS